MTSDPYLHIWEIDFYYSENRRKYGHLIDEVFEAELEAKIGEYLRENITFVCFPINETSERLRLEEGIIATLNSDKSFGPSSSWLGLKSPEPDIANSGLWNKQGLKGQILSDEEIDRIKWLARFGNENNENDTKPQ